MSVERLNQRRGKLARKAGRLNSCHGRGLPSLVLMTDDTLDADWVSAVQHLPRGSAVVVRHRDARAREGLARLLKPVCAGGGIKLLIADDMKLAIRVRADGVHLPRARAAKISEARMRNRRWLVTAAAHDRPGPAGANAIMVSPVFETGSHVGRRGIGVVRLAALVTASPCPVYALGGIDAMSIGRIGAVPVAGVALIRGWVGL